MTITDNAVNPSTGEVVEFDPNQIDAEAIIAQLKTGSGVVSTFTTESFEDRLKLLKTITDSKPLSDSVNTAVEIVHYVAQAAQVRDTQSGQTVEQVRVILLDSKGQGHHTFSKGVLISLRNIAAAMGDPNTWEKPVKMVVKQEGKAPNQYLTLKFA